MVSSKASSLERGGTYDIQLQNDQYLSGTIGFRGIGNRRQTYLAHVSIVLVHLLDISVDDFEGNEFVIRRVGSSNEEEGGVASIDNLRVWIYIHQRLCFVSRESFLTFVF